MSADELKQAALEALAEQAIVSAPREVFKLFPNWEARSDQSAGGCASSARQIAVQAPDAIFARPSHFLEAACRASLSDRKQAAPAD